MALRLAVNRLMKAGIVLSNPLVQPVSAVSCGIFEGEPVCDLDYEEDSNAEADSNFVLTGDGHIVDAEFRVVERPELPAPR